MLPFEWRTRTPKTSWGRLFIEVFSSYEKRVETIGQKRGETAHAANGWLCYSDVSIPFHQHLWKLFKRIIVVLKMCQRYSSAWSKSISHRSTTESLELLKSLSVGSNWQSKLPRRIIANTLSDQLDAEYIFRLVLPHHTHLAHCRRGRNWRHNQIRGSSDECCGNIPPHWYCFTQNY